MTIIKTLHGKIDEEIHDACDYAKLALEHKDAHRALADVFYTLSLDEVRHSMMLHNEVVKLIEEYRKEHGDPPEGMQAVYDYLHQQSIEKSEKVKRYQAMYKE